MIQTKIDREAFERIYKWQEEGSLGELNVQHIVDIFGWPAVVLFILIMPENKIITDLLMEIRDEMKKVKL